MIWEPSAPLRGLLRTHGMNYGDCVADRSFARCESKTREGAKNCSIGFSIRSFTRFPWALLCWGLIIACVPEIIGGFAAGEVAGERADAAAQARNCSLTRLGRAT